MNPEDHTLHPDTLKAIRASLLLKGSSLSAWATENGVKRQNLAKAISGEWSGPKADALIKRLLEFTGVVTTR